MDTIGNPRAVVAKGSFDGTMEGRYNGEVSFDRPLPEFLKVSILHKFLVFG